MVKEKMRNSVSILSGETWASVAPEKHIPIRKMDMKSPAISPPGKDPIQNQISTY